ncbi:MAG: hypothetical protein ACSHYA_07270 [Opitutaceae bacterium]
MPALLAENHDDFSELVQTARSRWALEHAESAELGREKNVHSKLKFNSATSVFSSDTSAIALAKEEARG